MDLSKRKRRVRRKLIRLGHFLGERLWEEEVTHMPGFQGFLYRQLRMLVVAGQALPRGQIPLRAAAMTVATLFAIVPGIVLVFSLLGAFGGFEQLRMELQRFILENLVADVQGQVSAFLEQYFAGATAFQGISIIFLFGGVFGLLGAMENAFNQIWGIKRGRGLSHRLTTYTTIAVLGPFLVALSLTMTASVQNTGTLIGLQTWAPVGGLVQLVFKLLPALVTIIGLMMLYMIMPNTKVHFVSALLGAVVAGLLWEISKWGYGLYISSATMYRTLYGPLVAIPLLFLWIQLSWIIVLFGALLTFAQEAADDFRLEEGAVKASLRERLTAALRCTIAICRARTATGDLLAGGLLHEIVRTRDRGEGGLVPARDLQNLSVYDLVSCLLNAGTSSPTSGEARETREAERILTRINSNLQQLAAPLTFARIVESLERGPGKERGTRDAIEILRQQ
jgi:membrane protein